MKIQLTHKNTALIFLISTTIISFIGDYIFKLLGVNLNRPLFYTKFFVAFVGLILFLSMLFRITRSSRVNKSTLYILPDTAFIKYLMFISIIFIPPMIFYLIILYKEVIISGQSFDEVRNSLQQSILFLPRFFWYSSLLLAYFLIPHKELSKKHKIFLKILKFSLFILLLLYGSKSLIFFPLIAAFIGNSITLSIKKLLGISVIILIFVLGSTIVNNLRSHGKFFLNEKIEVAFDIFASFSPEQRDGAYLMEINKQVSDKVHNVFIEDITFLFRGALNKHIVDKVIDVNTDNIIMNYIYTLQDYLGFKIGGSLNPRIGLIGFSYFFYRLKGLIINLLIYSFGLLLITKIYENTKHVKYRLFGNYLFVIWLWTYNSDFLINLDFFFYNLYFGTFLIISHLFFISFSHAKQKNPITRKPTIPIPY